MIKKTVAGISVIQTNISVFLVSCSNVLTCCVIKAQCVVLYVVWTSPRRNLGLVSDKKKTINLHTTRATLKHTTAYGTIRIMLNDQLAIGTIRAKLTSRLNKVYGDNTEHYLSNPSKHLTQHPVSISEIQINFQSVNFLCPEPWTHHCNTTNALSQTGGPLGMWHTPMPG